MRRFCFLFGSLAALALGQASTIAIGNPVPLPDGYELLPGVLHAYRASATDLAGYVEPGKSHKND
jgi:hypothetical protein